MALSPSIKIVKTFSYRQSNKDFSNRYHFGGGSPADHTAWDTFANEVTNGEQLIYDETVTIVRAIGYDAGSDIPVFSKDYNLGGAFTATESGTRCPGDCVALGRFSTDARTTKNHPIYLFNYFHGVWADAFDTDEQDVILPAQKTAIASYLLDWLNGITDGTTDHGREGPNSDPATSRLVEDYITHRDFPR